MYSSSSKIKRNIFKKKNCVCLNKLHIRNTSKEEKKKENNNRLHFSRTHMNTDTKPTTTVTKNKVILFKDLYIFLSAYENGIEPNQIKLCV